MRRLLIPACVCLLTWSCAFGPAMPWSFDAAASTHAKTKTKSKSRSKRPAEAADADPVKSTSTGADAPAATPDAATGKETPVAAAGNEPRENAAEQTISVLPPPKPAPREPVRRSRIEICDTLAKAARSNDLPVPFFIRLLFQESKFEADAVSHAGAQGIAQFMPKTAASVGLDNPFDPLQAIPAAARLLRDLANQFGNFGLAAAAYNAGPARVNKWLKKQGGLPSETRGYVKIITGQPAENWKSAKAGHGSNRLPQKAPCKHVSGLYAFNGTSHIPLPPKRPAPAIEPAPEVRIAEVTEKTPPKRGKAAASKTQKARHGKPTALQLAARRRQEAARRPH